MTVPNPYVMPLLVVVNILGLGSLVLLWRRLPGRCGECGRRGVLPLARLRWCAWCGTRAVVGPSGRR